MSNLTNNFIKFIKKNDTSILTGIGIADGLVLGGYLWYKTGQKVQNIINIKQQEKNRNLTFKEKVKETWKVFILPTVNTAVSAGLLIYSTRVGNRRIAALGAAYNLTEVAFQKYINKTKEVLGEKKAETVAQEVSKENVKDNSANSLVVVNGDGDTKFYEPLTDRYFYSTWSKIQKAANELNAAALSGLDGKISLTDWFSRIGLASTDISDDLIWDPQNYGKEGIIDISLDAVLCDDVPCGAIRYNTRPKYYR